MSDDDRFCPLCGVALDLHDGPDTCRLAEMKADLLDRFWTMAGGNRYRQELLREDVQL